MPRPTRPTRPARVRHPEAPPLAAREGCSESWIGHLDRSGEESSHRSHPGQTDVADRILPWLRASPWQAVVWTALPSTFEERTGSPFSVEAALAYLDALEGEVRARAQEYIRRAPATTVTPVRRALGTSDGRPRELGSAEP